MILSKQIYRRIANIDPEAWDRISTDVFTKHACLAEIEKFSKINIDPRYVVISKGNNIIAALPLYIETNTEYATLSESTFGKYHQLAKPLLALNPCLINHVPLWPAIKAIGIDETYCAREETYQLIINAIEGIAEKEKIPQYGFKYIAEHNDVFRKVLDKNGFIGSFAYFNVYFDVEWNDFDQYIFSLKSKRRSMVRKEIKEKERQQIFTRRAKSFGDEKEAILDQFNRNFYKYQRKESKINPEFLPFLQDEFKDHIGLIVDKKNDAVVSCSMYARSDDTMNLIKVGQDYSSVARQSHSFFNVSVYEPIKIAIEEKCMKINLGTGSYFYKLQRGAKIEPIYFYIKSSSKIKQAFLRGAFPILGLIKLKKHQKRLYQHHL